MSNIRPLRSMLPAAHQERFSKFAKDLESAVKTAIPAGFGKYERAAIMAFDWSNDTMGVKALRDELLRLLKRVYGFRTETYVMNANDPSDVVNRDFGDQVSDFVRRHRPSSSSAKHLLVYYYSGHSDSGPHGDELGLGGRVDRNQNLLLPHLNWYDHSAVALKAFGCETLLIMDSCNSAMAGIKADGEVLAAAGWESTTPVNMQQSFSRILIDEIQLQNGRSFTACELHASLMTGALVNNMGSTPIHKANVRHPSVLFHKIGTREAQQLVRATSTPAARVLITVSVASDVLPDHKQWKEWLTNHMPPHIRDIEIEAHWNGGSRTALVSIPIQLWDYLQNDPAYSYVSFVVGDVHPGYPSSEPAPLALRSQPAASLKENIRPQSSSSKPLR